MNIKISSTEKRGYLLIHVNGKIKDLQDWSWYAHRCYLEASKKDYSKILIDGRLLKLSPGGIDAREMVKSYVEEMPFEIRFYKLAVVLDPVWKQIGDCWEAESQKNGFGYRVYYDIKEAIKYLRSINEEQGIV